MEPADIRW